MSKINVNTWEPEGASTAATLMATGDTVTVPSGAELDIASGATLDVNGTIDVTGATVTGLTTGKVLQVVSVPVPEITASTTSLTYVDIAGMTLDITPSATTSNVLIHITMNIAGGATSVQGVVRLLRDTTPIFIGDQADTNRSRGMFTHRVTSIQSLPNYSSTFYDTAISTTSATTYKLQWATEPGETIYLNLANAGSDVLKYGTTISSITLMEIGA